MNPTLRTSITLTDLRRTLCIDRSAGRYVVTVRHAGGTNTGPVLAYATCRQLRLTSAEPAHGAATHMLWSQATTEQSDAPAVGVDLTRDEAVRLSDWLGLPMPTPMALERQA